MTRSLASIRASNDISASLAPAIQAQPFPQMPDDWSRHRTARAAHLATKRHLMPVPGPIPEQVTEVDLHIPARDGYNIHVIHYRPAKPSSTKLPGLVVLYHEGGWMNGDHTDEEFNARLLVRDLGVVVLNVEYRLAPEHKFPTWINDSWDVLEWAASNAADLGADPTQGFIVGGSSAGGNISAVLAHQSREKGLSPPVTGQWLSVPYLLPSNQIPEKYKEEFISWTENVSDPVLGRNVDDSDQGGFAYLTGWDSRSPLFSVLAPELYPPTPENQAGKAKMAKAFFQVGGMDPLRDHALIYDRILREEYGVETRLELYSGFGHMFWTNWCEMEESKQFAKDMVEGFRWLLKG